VPRSEIELRVLVLAPWGQDATLASEVLAGAGFACFSVPDVDALCTEAGQGAAALLVAEEALDRPALEKLSLLLDGQEPWSDLPIILLTGHGLDPSPVETLGPLGNVTLIERPLEIVTLVSAVSAAVRARRRQYGARATAESLRDADRRKTEFLATLSHELRNPLSAILNAVHLLGLQGDPARARRARAVIERQSNHLARLVDDLLDLTRIERGKIALRPRRIDLSEIARRTCEDHRQLFEDRSMSLRVEAPAAVWIEADPTRVAQMIGNLLQNAARFGRAGGSTVVTSAPGPGGAELHVRDDGTGIAPDLLPRLFTPFVQAADGRSRVQGGLGLGLSLVKGLAELHGGRVSAHSEGPGRGAEFVLEFPPATPPVRAAPAPSEVGRGESLRLLIVEDNADGARMLADLLETIGYRVEVAYDAAGALRLARRLTPDVILCDIGLPDMDGYELARTLRKEPNLAHTQLIALSGYAQEHDRERSAESGFDAHLAKPADLEQLKQALGRAARAAGS